VTIELRVREVIPEDSAAVVAIFNPIIEAGSWPNVSRMVFA
jgi:hypothetical protein